MTMDTLTPNPETVRPPVRTRISLVIIDDTAEWRTALRFACRRAAQTNGRVALLRVIEPAEFEHWMSVAELMREERRQEAEQLLQRVARDVNRLTGTMPALHVREGNLRDEVFKLIDEEPSISLLVLGANPSQDGPGPLIQHLATKRIGRMRIPVTIVPGGLSDDAIDQIA
ncbi:MAG: universal stress protein [Rhodospirillaceae bacterium]|nr:universal stress protein [Rhodospirillaceae bacterium]